MSNQIIEHKNSTSMILDNAAIDSYKDMAKLMAQSQVSLPAHLQGKPADCLAIVFQAAQWRMNPFVVAQKTHVINGTLGYEAQLVNAVVSSSTAIDGRFKYEFLGERDAWKPKVTKENKNGKDVWKVNFINPNAAVRVGAKLAGDDEVTWGEWVYPCDQSIFNSPLWRTNPKQQASYLAVKFWTRLYTPDVLLGVYTPDELEDSGQIKDVNPEPAPAKKGSAMDRLKSVGDKAKPSKKPEPTPDPEILPEEHPEPAEEIDEAMAEDMALSDFTTAVMECHDLKGINAIMADIASSEGIPDKHKVALREVCKEQIAKIKGDK